MENTAAQIVDFIHDNDLSIQNQEHWVDMMLKSYANDQTTQLREQNERLREVLNNLIVNARRIGPLPSRNDLTYLREEIKKAEKLIK